MSMHDSTARPDDDLAADYVMGLLEGAELATAEQRMTTDIAFAKAVNVWRERLADLDATAETLEPSAGLWDRIAESTKLKPVIPLPGARAALGGATLWHNIRFWRGAGIGSAFAALLLAVILIGALGTSRQLRNELIALAQSKPVYVAVLVNDTTHEAGAIVNAFSNGRVELIPLRPIDVPAGRTLQIWTLWDRTIGPKSIGLTGQSRTLQLDLNTLPETVADQLFEITLEPEGGSPIGRPTGPILFKGTTARAL
ncbi:anti-sigma factor domain-containing protein [Tardiphaga sp.]|jgi:anti-sigma-K factor RskA|uniref:anti-sigma factor n=1 Tax=Tardiphaga sp. TaxID=1926292 RepID=UPI0037D9A29E